MAIHFHDPNEPTSREIEVINLLYEGCTNKEIAWRLGIALRTAQHHLETAYQKLDAHGQVDAVKKALKAGWIDSERDYG